MGAMLKMHKIVIADLELAARAIADLAGGSQRDAAGRS